MFGGMGLMSSTGMCTFSLSSRHTHLSVSILGDVHQRQRRVMLPALTRMQLRSFLGVFQYTGEKVSLQFAQ